MGITKEDIQKQINERLGEIRENNQGCLMKIVGYNKAKDIIVEFQDEYKSQVSATYTNYLRGNIKNPYHPTIYGRGVVGDKYPTHTNRKATKEYQSWKSMLQRCFDKKYKTKQPTYANVECCDQWLLYEKFYEWLHNQPNFNKWNDGYRWAIDKDILIKDSKIYSPETCCLVPQNVNNLFTKSNKVRGNLPIGIHKHYKKYQASCQNPFTKKQEELGTYETKRESFQKYKEYKEDIIKQVAEIEYVEGNITRECYEAMMEYEVEIND